MAAGEQNANDGAQGRAHGFGAHDAPVCVAVDAKEAVENEADGAVGAHVLDTAEALLQKTKEAREALAFSRVVGHGDAACQIDDGERHQCEDA